MTLAYARQRLNYGPAKEMVADTIHGCGKFTTAGGSSPTVFSTGPWTIARTGTGTYTVTGTECFKEILFTTAELHQATGGNDCAFVVTGSSSAGTPSTKTPWTFTIETQSSAGTAADLTGPVVQFEIYARQGKLTK